MKIILQVKLCILIMLVCVPYAAGAPEAGTSVEIVEVRTGVHKDFHRLVIELSGEAGFTVLSEDGRVRVRMPGVALKFPLDRGISTDIIKFEGVTTARTYTEGPIATLNIFLKQGFIVNQLTRQEPFRIILDFSREAESVKVKEEYKRVLEELEGDEKKRKKVDVVTVKAPEAEQKEAVELRADLRAVKLAEVKVLEELLKEAEQKEALENREALREVEAKAKVPEKALEEVEEKKPLEELAPEVAQGEATEAEGSEGALKEAEEEELVKVGRGAEGTKEEFAGDKIEVPAGGVSMGGLADKFVIYKLMADKVAAERRADERRAAEEAAEEKLAVEKLAAEKLMAEKLVTEKFRIEKLAAEKLAANRLAIEKLAAEKEAAGKLAAGKLAAGKLAAGKEAAKEEAAGKLAAKEEAKKLDKPEPAPEGAPPKRLVVKYEGLNFNDAWKWEYRKVIIAMLKDDLLDTIEEDTLKAPLGLISVGREALAIEADALAKALKSMGKAQDAAVLDAVIEVFKKGTGRVALEVALRRNPSTSLKRLGWFFIARRLELVGLYPEALGYYSRVEALGEFGAVRPAATFSKARLRFIMGGYEDAKAGFERSVRDGFKGAGRWLANTLLIKGETHKAIELYKTLPDIPFEDINPIMLLGVGDIKVAAKDYKGALDAYERLRNRYAESELLASYFSIKKGDVYLATGEVDRAVKLYTEVRDSRKGEARAMAMLSLAGVLSMSGETASVIEAEEIYRQVARGETIGAVFADLNMVSTEAALGSYETALTSLARFKFRYTTHPLRKYASSLKGDILHNWIVELYKAGDHYGIAKAVARHGTKVPFGKKAETYLRIGISYGALGLYPDAVRALRISAEIGAKRVAEEAMLALARTYLARKDHALAARAIKNFSKRFPKSRYGDDIKGMKAEVAYMVGDYKAYVDFAAKGGDADLMMARALQKLKRYKESLAVYKSVAGGLKGTGDIEGLKSAYIGAADTSFMLRRYTGAIGYYRTLLKLIEKDGNGDTSWALFRITQSYSKLKKRDEQRDALKAIKGIDDTFGRSAEPLFGGRVGNL